MTEPTDTKTGDCPECGAPTVEGMSCWEMLGAMGAGEWQGTRRNSEELGGTEGTVAMSAER